MGERPNKVEQILNIEPKNELHFKGPYTEIVTEYLTLINLSDNKVCFKIKTTAPKRYCVRPNCGIIDPKNTTKVAVMLQPLGTDLLLIQEYKNRHKFMVQTIVVNEGEINQEALWKTADRSLIMESKLKCVFDLPEVEQKEIKESITDSLSSQFNATKSNEDTGIGKSEEWSGNQETDENLLNHNKKLNEELTNLRQQLMQAKEEFLRQRFSKSQSGPNISELLDTNLDQNLNVGIKSNFQILVFGIVIFFLGIFYAIFFL